MSKLSCAGLRVVLTVGLGMLACCHAHGTGADRGGAAKAVIDDRGADGASRSSPVAPDPRGPAVGDDAATQPPTRLGPIRRAAPFVFVPHPGTAVLARVTKTLRAATVGLDPQLRVEIGCPHGARVIDRGKIGKLPLGKSEARSAVVDPSEQWLAVELTTGRVDVFARAQLRRLGTWSGSRPIALDPERLVLRQDCRWIAVDPGKPELAPKTLAEDLCGDVVHMDPAQRLLLVSETPADSTRVRAIVRIGDDGGGPPRVELPADLALTDVAVSADAKIVCGIAAGPGRPSLQCRALAGGEFERVAQGVVGPLRFANDLPRLAFAVALDGTDALDLHVVDFDQRFVRKLGRVHQHRFAFLPGGERLVAYEGGRGFVFDLESGYLVPFGDREDDWAAVVPLPATQDVFLATRVKKRCNDLVRITLPED